MNAVVMEIKDGKAAILTKEGTFECVKDLGYSIGQRIDVDESSFAKADVVNFNSYKGRKKKSTVRRIATVAATFAVVATAFGVTSYAVPCTVVTMDINPSISMSLNIYDKVISVDAYNDDGASIASNIRSKAKGRKLDDAFEIALDELKEGSYIDGEDTDVVTSVSTHFKRPAGPKHRISGAVDDWNKKAKVGDVSVALECVDVPSDVAKEAKKKKVSPAKLTIVREAGAKKKPKEFNEDEWMKKSVKEINEVRRPAPKNDDRDSKSNNDDKDNSAKDKPSKKPDKKPDIKPDEQMEF
jgi:hypothetical protein